MNLHFFRGSKFLVALLFSVFLSNHGLAQGTWKALTHQSPHYNNGVALLMTDGSVIVKTNAGGGDAYGWGWDRLRPDSNGSYINGTWDTIASMGWTRQFFASQVLKDGRVYVAGGELGTGYNNGEIYDPIANVWTPLPSNGVSTYINDCMSELLPDGTVMQNFDQGSVFFSFNGNLIYNPVTNTFDTTDRCIESQEEGEWVKLPDGSFLAVDANSQNSERYIPSLGQWIPDDTLPVMLWSPDIELGPGVLLPDGRAMFFGGNGATAFYTPSGSVSPGTWAAGPALPYSTIAPYHVWATKDANAAMMPNGKILFVAEPYTGAGFSTPAAFFEFNYLTDSFTRILTPNGDSTLEMLCEEVHMLQLPDGSVLTGTANGSTQYYEYVPDGTPLVEGKPVVDSVFKISCDTFVVTGQLFNGISEGVTFGDDWQMATNRPIVRFTHDSTVYYAKSINWNRTGVMTGTLPDTVTIILPSTMPEGIYNMQVTANGNPSAPFAFATCGASLASLNTVTVNPQTERVYIYPNPASENATVTFDCAKAGIYDLKILDIYGRIVNEQTLHARIGENKYAINLNGMAKGIYTILLQGGAQEYHGKLVVE